MSYVKFSGTDSEYRLLHFWVEKQLGKPQNCSNCGISDYRYEWANISGNYLKDVTDWERLCASCHRRKDSFGDPNMCKRGHKVIGDNVYLYPNVKHRSCRACRKLMSKKSKPRGDNNK